MSHVLIKFSIVPHAIGFFQPMAGVDTSSISLSRSRPLEAYDGVSQD